MKLLVLVVCAACAAHVRPVEAQSITAEAAVTGGYSTDEASAAAVQARLFGDVRGVRFFGEVAWANRWLSDSDHETDSSTPPIRIPIRCRSSKRTANVCSGRAAGWSP